jgi:PAS domain S-box-containing protein
MTTPSAAPEFDSAELYRSLFTAYPDALLLVDTAGTVVLANPQACQLLGYAMHELTGLPVDALVPDAIRPRHAAYRSSYAHRPRPRPMGTHSELVARRRDGSTVMVEISLSPLQDEALPYVVAAVRGIGEYPRVQQALQQARYSECVSLMGRLAVDARDPQALLQRVPAAAAEALQVDSVQVLLLDAERREFRLAAGVGLLPDEVLGSTVPNHTSTPPGFAAAQGAPVVVGDFRAERRFAVPPLFLQHAVVSGLTVPLSDRGQTTGVLAVRTLQPRQFEAIEIHFLESLAHLVATTVQRSQSEEALNHAQRLESVGQLTGGIAHDFNNLLTIIQGNLQVLEEHPALRSDGSAQPLLAAAARAGRRGAELTSKLLAFSRRQVLSPQRVDVAGLLQSLAGMLQRTLDQHVRIELDVQHAAPCRADPGQLEAALLNLAINARDAMPEGGVLSFSARVSGPLPAELADELNANADAGQDRYIEIDVADTGRGMTDTVRERAFEPFFTTKELGRGTGLGLSTVYGFVKQSHGAVRLTTAPGAGTTVTLVLPRFVDATAHVVGAPPAPQTLPRGLRVMLVEDEAEVRSVVRQALLALGCSIIDFPTA